MAGKTAAETSSPAAQPDAPTRTLHVLGRPPRTKWEALEVQQRQILAHFADLAQQNLETRRLIAQGVEDAFAAKWDAKFRELDGLRNECARMLRRLIDSGRLTQAAANEAARG